MSLMKIIQNRRSIGKVKEVVPNKEKIEQILEAGRWAPSHYRTEPWKFIVLQGEARIKLGEAYAEINLEEMEQPTAEEKKQAYEKGVKKAKRAPVIIALIVEPVSGETIEWIEEVEACACAAQNMMLMAHELGLGTIWRTGKPTYHRIMKETFNVSNKGMVLGFLYIGYPDMQPKNVTRKPLEDKVEWWTE
ncbi:nitroreductase family protein [Bacillus taeanensis]|uniref:Putative NAD(P)H nitroreductase n=1 Tax=Bacillus taeanensis TaxID=273032 RepID=A0A366XY22_9BACI|nr:nitroreductase [Bacillus taeanensis]RBW70536.1 nitroreductase [Bacillus taeanensis]